MKLIVFDIDGTLTDTNHVDGISFIEAWQSAYKIAGLSTVWSDYKQSTDSGIFAEVFEKYLKKSPKEEDRNFFRMAFLKILENYSKTSPQFFTEVSGANSVLKQLKKDGVAVSVATGAWRESGIIKLRSAGLWSEELPLAAAEDAFARADILRTSIKRAQDFYKCSNFDDVTYIGDGIWDWKASQEVGVKFIGRSDRGSLVGKVPPDTLLLTDYSKGSGHLSAG